MATVNTNSKFVSYILTDQEQRQGSILSHLNKMVIQNLINLCAEEKVAMDFDPDAPQKFLQQEAELKGQILILQQLLIASDEAEQGE